MIENPDCVISGSGNGSGAGLTAVASGTVTIGNSDVFAETKLEADEAAKLVDHEVAVVGMGPIVSKNVTVDDLTLEQLKGIIGGTIPNRSEVGGVGAEICVVHPQDGAGPLPPRPARAAQLRPRPAPDGLHRQRHFLPRLLPLR